MPGMKHLTIVLSILFNTNLLAQVPQGTDVYVASCAINENKFSLQSPVNITNREGYDNQPHFSIDGKLLYYVAIKDDGQSDVYTYDFKTQKSLQLTKTVESEYSPKISLAENAITVVRVETDSTQLLWNYALNGTNPEVICTQVDSVGYYTHVNQNEMAFFKVTAVSSLWLLNKKDCKESLLASNVGRSIQALNDGQVYFTQMIDSVRWIVKMNLKNRQLEKVVKMVEEGEDFALLGNDYFCMSAKSKLYTFKKENNQTWVEIADFSSFGLNNLKRIAFNKNLTKLAFVNDAAAKK